MSDRRCIVCGDTKPQTEFYRNRARKSGWDTRCKDCERVRDRAHHSKNYTRDPKRLQNQCECGILVDDGETECRICAGNLGCMNVLENVANVVEFWKAIREPGYPTEEIGRSNGQHQKTRSALDHLMGWS